MSLTNARAAAGGRLKHQKNPGLRPESATSAVIDLSTQKYAGELEINRLVGAPAAEP
jgi:hypothetical protein